jgi:hypothetical protein
VNGSDIEARGEDTFGVPGLRTDAMGVVEWPVHMTFEQWDDLGVVACEARDWTAWVVGDWLVFGEDKWKGKDRYAQARALTNRSYGGLRNLASVARKIPRSKRRASLSWSHHRLVASFDDEAVRDYWLDRAEAEGWTVDLLESMLRDAGLVTSRLQREGESEVVAAVRELRREYVELDAERVTRVVREGLERERRETKVIEISPLSEPRQLEFRPESVRDVALEIVTTPADEHGRVCLDRNLLERLRVALVQEQVA